MALLPLIPSWLGLLGGWHWGLDLLSHFRWQYLLVSAIVIAGAAWWRQRVAMMAAVLTFLLNAFLIGLLARHPHVGGGAVAQAPVLRVLSLNVLTSNTARQRVLDHVAASGADVVFLMEVDQRWLAALAVLDAQYPYRIVQPRPDNFGFALLSRIPLENARVLRFGGAELPSVEARLTLQGRQIVFIGTHPMPPVGHRHAALWERQLRSLADHVSQIREPVLLAGDLNATPWSAGMRMLTAGKLGLRTLDPPWRPTWSVGSMLAIPIDHALCTAPLVISSRTVGPDVGSDHRPLHLVVGWAAAT